MFDNILFPTDGSDPTESVLEYVIEIASEHDATVHVLHVVDTEGDSLSRLRGDDIDTVEQEGERIVADAAKRASDDGVPVTTTVLRGDPPTSIVDYSERHGVDCIVMPTQGRRGVQRYLLGSVTERVINTASVPVIAVNPDRERPLRYPCQHVLVPTDRSRGGELAVSQGIDVAKATGATLLLLHVVETGSLGPDARSLIKEEEWEKQGSEIIAAATETIEAASVESPITVIERGEPAKRILDYIGESDIDLTIMGTHGQTDFSRYVMGGVSAKLVRTSPVPVMWVRDSE